MRKAFLRLSVPDRSVHLPEISIPLQLPDILTPLFIMVQVSINF